MNLFYEIYRQNCIEANIPPKPKKAIDLLAKSGGAQGNAPGD